MIGELFKLLKQCFNSEQIVTKVMKFREGGTFKYNITLSDLTEVRLRSLLDKLSGFNHSEEVEIYINDYPFGDGEECEIESERNILGITIIQSYLHPNNDGIFFYKLEDFYAFEEQFLSSCKLGDLKAKNKKIVVKLVDGSDITSPIFSTDDSQVLSISTVLTGNKNFCHANLFAVPDLVNSINIERYGEKAIFQIFEILSEKNISNTEFIISFNRNSILEISSISINEDLFINIYAIMNFLFTEPEKYYERLEIFKDLFSKIVNKKQNISSEDFKHLYRDVRTNYNLFIADKMVAYLEEKQRLTEEYTRVHREILDSIRRIISDLAQQIIVLLGAILSFLMFDGLDEITKILLISIVELIYLLCVCLLNCKKGWDFESRAIFSEKRRFQELYELLYSVEPNFIKTLDEEFNGSLKRLQSIEKLNKFIVLFLLVVVFSIFIWA